MLININYRSCGRYRSTVLWFIAVIIWFIALPFDVIFQRSITQRSHWVTILISEIFCSRRWHYYFKVWNGTVLGLMRFPVPFHTEVKNSGGALLPYRFPRTLLSQEESCCSLSGIKLGLVSHYEPPPLNGCI